MMQSQTILSIMLLSSIALATSHEKGDIHSEEIESGRLGNRWKDTNFLYIDFFKSASLPHVPQTTNIQIISSVLAQEPSLSALIQAIITPLPSSLRDQKLISLYGELASKASGKEAGVGAAAANSLRTSHPTQPSKATSSPPSNSETSITSTPKRTAIPTARDGALSNFTAEGGSNNSTTSAPIIISTTPTAASDSATQDAAEALSTLETSSIPNVGTVQPTGVLKVKAAGALAVGVAGMMILL